MGLQAATEGWALGALSWVATLSAGELLPLLSTALHLLLYPALQRWMASEAQIKSAYRKAALIHHPDKQVGVLRAGGQSLWLQGSSCGQRPSCPTTWLRAKVPAASRPVGASCDWNRLIATRHRLLCACCAGRPGRGGTEGG